MRSADEVCRQFNSRGVTGSITHYTTPGHQLLIKRKIRIFMRIIVFFDTIKINHTFRGWSI